MYKELQSAYIQNWWLIIYIVNIHELAYVLPISVAMCVVEGKCSRTKSSCIVIGKEKWQEKMEK